ncbi:MAG: hypothetical protein ACYC27_17825 [Armatimonadota bacterium]
MAVKPTIKCNCGQKIVSKDVMQTGYYLRLFGPSFVYVKFRCSRCKKLGEQFVKQEDWEDGILKDIHAEVNQVEKQEFQAMGPISMHEQIDFHFNLEEPDVLAKLTDMIKPVELSSENTEEDNK